jgi:hypothetical protein
MRHVAAPLLGLAFALSASVAGAADFTQLPWDLRPYYEFKVDNTAVRYATDNAEWDLFLEPSGMLASRVSMSVTLKDGREITNLDMDQGAGTRARAELAQGAGVHYTTTMPSKHGISVNHSFFVNTTRPFYVIDVKVTNTSDQPLEIARISPLIFAPGSFATLSPQTSYTERPITLIARWPLFDPVAPPLSVMVRDEPNNFTMVMGLMPSGQAESRPRLYQAGGGWQGDVVCEFNPPITLQPGQSLSADPVWICFALPDMEQADILFAWTHSEEPRKYNAEGMLDAWATVPALEDASALYAAQKVWMGLGVRHTLVPDGWEGRPGSLKGGTPRFPEDMGRVAQTIRGSGGFPGLTIDPLLTDSNAAYTAVTDAGIRYINLADAQGYAHAVERMRRLNDWGYDFYVVVPSSVPNEVLAHFAMTRRQADALAVRVMEEAAAGKLVYPAPRGTLAGDSAAWERADAASQRMYDFSMAIGPVRLTTNDGGAFTPELSAIIKDFDGPVEVVGIPSTGSRRTLSGLFPRKRTEYLASLPPISKDAKKAIDDEKAVAELEAQPEKAPKPEKTGGFFQNIKNRIVD